MDLIKVDELLKEYDEHRIAIKVMIADLEALKDNIDRIIPTTLEARYVRFFEEKIKTVTSLFNALLEMRKEIARSVKEEIEIRRKVDKGESQYDIEEIFNKNRTEIFKEHGKISEDGNQYIIEDPFAKDLVGKLIDELMEEEVEINIPTITLEDLGEIDMELGVLVQLHWLIKE